MICIRTPGCDLPDARATEIFNEHVTLVACSPKTRWSLKKVTNRGDTSDWAAVKKAYPELNSILEATEGLIPPQVSLERAFQAWLSNNHLDWSPSDRARCILHLRMMLSTLQDRKRRRQGPPRNFPELGILLDMLRVAKEDSASDSGSPAQPRPRKSPQQADSALVALGVAQDYVPRRVVGKQDAVAIVEPPKDVVMVDLVDDSGDEVSAASSDLETALFPSLAGKLGRVGPLDAAKLAELAAGTVRGPGPAAYKKTKKDDDDDDDEGDDADGMTVPKRKPMKVMKKMKPMNVMKKMKPT